MPRFVAALIVCSSWLGGALEAINYPPTIEHPERPCAAVARRVLLCADVADDHGVGEVRVVFRAFGTRGFYWTTMSFDGSRFCTWLPAPLPQIEGIEYYVEAFDDAYESSRTRSFVLPVRNECPASSRPAPTKPARVGRASPAIDPAPPGFDPSTLEPLTDTVSP